MAVIRKSQSPYRGNIIELGTEPVRLESLTLEAGQATFNNLLEWLLSLDIDPRAGRTMALLIPYQWDYTFAQRGADYGPDRLVSNLRMRMDVGPGELEQFAQFVRTYRFLHRDIYVWLAPFKPQNRLVFGQGESIGDIALTVIASMPSEIGPATHFGR